MLVDFVDLALNGYLIHSYLKLPWNYRAKVSTRCLRS